MIKNHETSLKSVVSGPVKELVRTSTDQWRGILCIFANDYAEQNQGEAAFRLLQSYSSWQVDDRGLVSFLGSSSTELGLTRRAINTEFTTGRTPQLFVEIEMPIQTAALHDLLRSRMSGTFETRINERGHSLFIVYAPTGKVPNFERFIPIVFLSK